MKNIKYNSLQMSYLQLSVVYLCYITIGFPILLFILFWLARVWGTSYVLLVVPFLDVMLEGTFVVWPESVRNYASFYGRTFTRDLSHIKVWIIDVCEFRRYDTFVTLTSKLFKDTYVVCDMFLMGLRQVELTALIDHERRLVLSKGMRHRYMEAVTQGLLYTEDLPNRKPLSYIAILLRPLIRRVLTRANPSLVQLTLTEMEKIKGDVDHTYLIPALLKQELLKLEQKRRIDEATEAVDRVIKQINKDTVETVLSLKGESLARSVHEALQVSLDFNYPYASLRDRLAVLGYKSEKDLVRILEQSLSSSEPKAITLFSEKDRKKIMEKFGITTQT